MPYPEGMTYQMDPPVESTAYDVLAWDEAYPDSVDTLGTYETVEEALDAADFYNDHMTYDVIEVTTPYTITHHRSVNPFGDKVKR